MVVANINLGGFGRSNRFYGAQLVLSLVYCVVSSLALVAQELLACLAIEGSLSFGVC